MKKYALVCVLIAFFSLTLTACGGGGSSSTASNQSSGSGNNGSSTGTPVTPKPPVSTYQVSGAVYGPTGLPAVLSVSNNGGTPIQSTGGSFTFAGLAQGAAYNISVTPPTGDACSVIKGSGTISTANVSDVVVVCQVIQPVVMACGTDTNIGSGNTAPLVIDGFPCAAGGTAQFANTFNEPYTSVKICAHGSTTNCQVIDHVIVDTGSTGLRVAASALKSSLQPGVAGGLSVVAGSTTGNSLTECETYVSSYVYGPVVTADVYIAGKQALGVEMQVFGGSDYPVPSVCSSQGGTSTNTTQVFGANGLIGVSFEEADYGGYFNCLNTALGTCTLINTAYGEMPNIVGQFSGDNNGVVLTLPSISADGSLAPVQGSLVFGVSTQSNNTPPSNAVAVANDGNNDSTAGTFAVSVGGTWYTAYIDSGTAVNFFTDTSDATALNACSAATGFQGLYCPATNQSITFNLANTGTTSGTTYAGQFNFSVTNPTSPSIQNAVVAVSNFAGPIASSSTAGGSAAFGLTSFFGHSIYFLFNGQTAPGTGLGGTSPTLVTGPINSIQ